MPICNNRFLWFGDTPTPTSTNKNSTRKIKTHIFHFLAKRPKNILHNFVGSFFFNRHHMAQFVKRTNECFSYYHKKKQCKSSREQNQATENRICYVLVWWWDCFTATCSLVFIRKKMSRLPVAVGYVVQILQNTLTT